MGARRVVITLGEHGLISVSDEQRLRLGSYAVDFVDGSGGGDAFDAGYIVGLLEDRSELDCLKLASAVVQAACERWEQPPASLTGNRPVISCGGTR